MTARWLSLRWFAAQLPNAPEIFELTASIARRRGAHEEGVRNYNAPWNWIHATSSLFSNSPSAITLLRRYPDADCHDRSRIVASNRMIPRRRRREASFTSIGKLTLDLYTKTIDEIRAKNPASRSRVSPICGFSALSRERDATAADMALTALGDATFGDSHTQFDAAFGRGLLARMMKDENKGTRRVCRDSTGTGENGTGAAGFGPAVCTLALIDAGLGGRKMRCARADALRVGTAREGCVERRGHDPLFGNRRRMGGRERSRSAKSCESGAAPPVLLLMAD